MPADYTLSYEWNPSLLQTIGGPQKMSFPVIYIPFYESKCTTIDDLDDYCLDAIFSHFDLIELFSLTFVSKRWYYLCSDRISRSTYFSTETFENVPMKWEKSQIMYPFPSFKSVISVVNLAQDNLRTLSLSSVCDMTAEKLALCANLLPNLQELELCESYNFSQNMARVIGNKLCSMVESLSLHSCHLEHLDLLLQSARKLKHLSISCFEYDVETEEVFPIHDYIPSDCPLTSIRFHGFPSLHIDSIKFLLKLFSATLEYIDLSYTNLQGIFTKPYLLPKLPCMKKLIAPIDTRDSDELMLYAPDRAAFLQMQHTHAIVKMLKLMPNLRVLDMTNSSLLSFSVPNFVEVLVKHCPLLEELYLGSCRIPAEELYGLRYLVRLKKLCLDHNDPFSMVSSILFTSPYDYAAAFRFIATHVVSHLKELLYFSFTHGHCGYSKSRIQGEDLFLFLQNAGPKFKDIFLTADKTEENGGPYDFVAKGVKMCRELALPQTINLNIENTLSFDVLKASSTIKYFDSIAPSSIQVNLSNNFAKKHAHAAFGDHITMLNF